MPRLGRIKKARLIPLISLHRYWRWVAEPGQTIPIDWVLQKFEAPKNPWGHASPNPNIS